MLYFIELQLKPTICVAKEKNTLIKTYTGILVFSFYNGNIITQIFMQCCRSNIAINIKIMKNIL